MGRVTMFDGVTRSQHCRRFEVLYGISDSRFLVEMVASYSAATSLAQLRIPRAYPFRWLFPG